MEEFSSISNFQLVIRTFASDHLTSSKYIWYVFKDLIIFTRLWTHIHQVGTEIKQPKTVYLIDVLQVYLKFII